MRLFTLGSDFLVEINKEWILLIPPFRKLIHRDKGSLGDADGRKKLRARQELTFIYFDLDFSSPLRNWEPKAKRAKALAYAELTEKDIDKDIKAAHAEYYTLLLESSKALRTLENIWLGWDKMNEDIKKVDSPNAFLSIVAKLDDAYNTIIQFEERVLAELANEVSIRGSATLGRKEGAKRKWSEGSSEITPPDPPDPGTTPITSELSGTIIPPQRGTFRALGAELRVLEEGDILNDTQGQ